MSAEQTTTPDPAPAMADMDNTTWTAVRAIQLMNESGRQRAALSGLLRGMARRQVRTRQIVLGELERLRAMEQRAREVQQGASETMAGAADYILGPLPQGRRR